MIISIIQLLSVCDIICLDFIMLHTSGKAHTSVFQTTILEYFKSTYQTSGTEFTAFSLHSQKLAL